MSDGAIEGLKKHGFTEYEARAFAALVGLRLGTAREVCELSGVPHGRIYSVLEELADRGFIEVQEGSPILFRVEDTIELFDAIKRDYCSSVDRLVDRLKEIKAETRLSPSLWSTRSFWSIRSEKAIQNRLKTVIRNAEQDIIILSKDPRPLLSLADDLRAAGKRVSLAILAPDAFSLSGTGLRVHAIGKDLSGMLEEMAQKSGGMLDPSWDTELFIIVDGIRAVAVGDRLGKRMATVIEMAPEDS